MTDPRKNLPKSILFGTLIVIGVYLLANVAYLSVFSIQDIGKSPIIAADTMSSLVGNWGVNFIVGTVMISTFGTLNATVLTTPRIFFALSEDKLFVPQFASVHPKFKTPYVSVILCGCLGALYVIIASFMSGSKAFGALTDAFVIGIVPFYALSVGSVFVFRGREKKRRAANSESLEDSLVDPVEPGHPETHPHPYTPSVKVPLYPVVPLLFVASTVFLLVNSLLDLESRVPTLITIGLVLVGIPLYYGTIGRRTDAA